MNEGVLARLQDALTQASIDEIELALSRRLGGVTRRDLSDGRARLMFYTQKPVKLARQTRRRARRQTRDRPDHGI